MTRRASVGRSPRCVAGCGDRRPQPTTPVSDRADRARPGRSRGRAAEEDAAPRRSRAPRSPGADGALRACRARPTDAIPGETMLPVEQPAHELGRGDRRDLAPERCRASAGGCARAAVARTIRGPRPPVKARAAPSRSPRASAAASSTRSAVDSEQHRQARRAVTGPAVAHPALDQSTPRTSVVRRCGCVAARAACVRM